MNHYKAGGYPELTSETRKAIRRRSQMLRITAYNDAASNPFDAWDLLIKKAPSGRL